jgi:hypothetical protein
LFCLNKVEIEYLNFPGPSQEKPLLDLRGQVKKQKKLFFKPLGAVSRPEIPRSPPSRQRKNRMTPGEEGLRVISPVKPLPRQSTLLESESGYEASSQGTPGAPSTPLEFLHAFVKLRVLLKLKPLPIRDLNKSLLRLSSFKEIPTPAFLAKTDKKVRPSDMRLHKTHFLLDSKRC